MSKAKTPAAPRPLTRKQVTERAAELAPQIGDTIETVADLYPLSKRATRDQVAAAGLTNGMSPEAVEAALSRVMPADE